MIEFVLSRFAPNLEARNTMHLEWWGFLPDVDENPTYEIESSIHESPQVFRYDGVHFRIEGLQRVYTFFPEIEQF